MTIGARATQRTAHLESITDSWTVASRQSHASSARELPFLPTKRQSVIAGKAHEQGLLTLGDLATLFPAGPPNPYRLPSDEPSPIDLRRRAEPGSYYLREWVRTQLRLDVLRRVRALTPEGYAFVVGEVGFKILRAAGKTHGLKRLGQIDQKNFVHSVAVNSARWLFEQFGMKWTSERVLRRRLALRKVPDGLATSGATSIAIEVELTRKDLARYVEIFAAYLNWGGPPLSSVLYVLPGPADLEGYFRAVLPGLLARTELWGLRSPDLSLFRFTTTAALPSRTVWWTDFNPSQPSRGTL